MEGIHKNSAYKEGMRSYFTLKGKYQNPYSPGSIEFNAFERGWAQSLKRVPEAVSKQFDQSNKTKSQHEERRKKQEAAAYKQAYLKSKGY